MSRVLIGVIKLYSLLISPWLGPNCRYMPTCSSYAVEAISLHGPLKGSAMSVWRIVRCNPFSKGGYDPVPASDKRQD
jgi:hypothetical protein